MLRVAIAFNAFCSVNLFVLSPLSSLIPQKNTLRTTGSKVAK